ncbi:MipA/OmpV family protein [Amphritea pacifica]|uniref:MipA/OmpV family protein n=1 Tax=Amphritea pacifica TaxID=2811233 RepID=A0ABS2WD62_9GAMM|nr:MipA/OmpV family protein [Amphritea pacifica]MBN0989565.1 MipA/OmpV family protein [Amphritea pacifica]
MRSGINPIVMGGMLMGLSSCLLAEDNVDGKSQVQVGLVASVNSSFYRGADNDLFVLPLVIAEYGRFYLNGVDAGYRFYQREDGQRFAIEVGRTFDGYESGDSSFLSGMAERKAVWEARIVYEALVGGGRLKGKLMQDISDRHGGFSARLNYEHLFWQNETTMVTWVTGGEYWDSAKTDYYFGVRDSETRLNRQAYSASENLSLFVGSNVIKKLSPNVSLVLSAEYRMAGDAVDESPIVADGDQWSAYGGIFYKF